MNHDSAADKMENTMQNIILQEMENLNGILIATTNLQSNMDRAFEPIPLQDSIRPTRHPVTCKDLAYYDSGA